MDFVWQVILNIVYVTIVGYLFHTSRKIYLLTMLKEFLFMSISLFCFSVLPIATLSIFIFLIPVDIVDFIIIAKFIIVTVLVLGGNLLAYVMYQLAKTNAFVYFLNQINLTIIFPSIIWAFIQIDDTGSIKIYTHKYAVYIVIVGALLTIYHQIFQALYHIWRYNPTYSALKLTVGISIMHLISLSSIMSALLGIINPSFILLGFVFLFIPIAIVFMQDPLILLTSPPQPLFLLVYDSTSTITVATYKFTKHNIGETNITLISGVFASIELFLQGISKSNAVLNNIKLDQFSIIFERNKNMEFVYFVEKYTRSHNALLKILTQQAEFFTKGKITTEQLEKLDKLVHWHFRAQNKRLNMHVTKFSGM